MARTAIAAGSARTTTRSCSTSNTSGPATSRKSRTGSIPTRTSTSARSSGSSTAAPGTTSRSKPRFRTPATSSAPMSARPRWSSRAPQDGSINVVENRCAHRAAEFCRELTGTINEFVCPYHQWTYDLKGNLIGVPFRRGVGGKGGMPKDFDPAEHGLRKLNVTTHRGVVFASYRDDMEPFADYLGPDVLREFEATFDGRKLEGARPLPPFAAGQLEALSREPQGPLSRHAAAHVPGDVRPARRRQPLADADRRERAARRDGVGQVGRQGRLRRRQEGDARLQGRHDAARAALHGFRPGVRQPVVGDHVDDLAEPDRAARDEHARHPADRAERARTSSS